MRPYKVVIGKLGGKRIKVTYQSAIPPRDWKFWTMTAVTAVWFGLLGFILLKSASTPTVSQWWKDQSLLEQKGGKNVLPVIESESALKVRFPKDGDYYQLNFDVLSDFQADAPDMVKPKGEILVKGKKKDSTVPEPIKALNGKKISVSGFMVPMIMDRDKVSSFILAQSRMACCYGVVPKLNQWIYVKMDAGKTAESMMDIPITVFGTFSVGREFDSGNNGWCLYRMTSDKIEAPRKTWF